MVKCPVCGLEMEKPFREVDLGHWSLSIIRDYKCCNRTFREYIRKTKESLRKGLNKEKTMWPHIPMRSESTVQWDDEEEWSDEESFDNAGEW